MRPKRCYGAIAIGKHRLPRLFLVGTVSLILGNAVASATQCGPNEFLDDKTPGDPVCLSCDLCSDPTKRTILCERCPNNLICGRGEYKDVNFNICMPCSNCADSRTSSLFCDQCNVNIEDSKQSDMTDVKWIAIVAASVFVVVVVLALISIYRAKNCHFRQSAAKKDSDPESVRLTKVSVIGSSGGSEQAPIHQTPNPDDHSGQPQDRLIVTTPRNSDVAEEASEEDASLSTRIPQSPQDGSLNTSARCFGPSGR